MDSFGIYRGPLGDLTWNQPGPIVTVNYENGKGWRYTRAMHETKWWNPADPERILANHVIMMSCPCPWDQRIFPELWVCSAVDTDVPFRDIRIQITAWSPIEDGVCAVVYRCPCGRYPCQRRIAIREMKDTPDLPAVRWAMVTGGQWPSADLPKVFALIMPAENTEGLTRISPVMPTPGSASGK